MPEVFWKLGMVAEELLEGECSWTAFCDRFLCGQRMQPATVEHRLETWVEFPKIVPGSGVTQGFRQRSRQTLCV